MRTSSIAVEATTSQLRRDRFLVVVRAAAAGVLRLHPRELALAKQQREARRHDRDDDDAAEKLGEREPPAQQRPEQDHDRDVHVRRRDEEREDRAHVGAAAIEAARRRGRAVRARRRDDPETCPVEQSLQPRPQIPVHRCRRQHHLDDRRNEKAEDQPEEAIPEERRRLHESGGDGIDDGHRYPPTATGACPKSGGIKCPARYEMAKTPHP